MDASLKLQLLYAEHQRMVGALQPPLPLLHLSGSVLFLLQLADVIHRRLQDGSFVPPRLRVRGFRDQSSEFFDPVIDVEAPPPLDEVVIVLLLSFFNQSFGLHLSQLSLDRMQVGRAAVTNGKRRHGVPDAATIPVQQVLRIRELRFNPPLLMVGQ